MTAIEMIAAERARQLGEEGWTPEHDDEHGGGEIACAAACYALAAGEEGEAVNPIPQWWPWAYRWWKPAPWTTEGRIRMLVKAGALIVAEIERLQRAGGEE